MLLPYPGSRFIAFTIPKFVWDESMSEFCKTFVTILRLYWEGSRLPTAHLSWRELFGFGLPRHSLHSISCQSLKSAEGKLKQKGHLRAFGLEGSHSDSSWFSYDNKRKPFGVFLAKKVIISVHAGISKKASASLQKWEMQPPITLNPVLDKLKH